MVRRVITSNNLEGRSFVDLDGEARSVHELAAGALIFHELWRTAGPLASTTEVGDPVGPELEVLPDRGGTALRVVELAPTPPGSAGEMHATPTTDYNIVLSGEITAIGDTGEVRLQAGDVLIQRGGRHGWRNDGENVCVFASVMVNDR